MKIYLPPSLLHFNSSLTKCYHQTSATATITKKWIQFPLLAIETRQKHQIESKMSTLWCVGESSQCLAAAQNCFTTVNFVAALCCPIAATCHHFLSISCAA